MDPGKSKGSVKIVINGAGAAGIAITNLLIEYGFKNILVCDSKGIISNSRTDLDVNKQELAQKTNQENKTGGLIEAVQGSDVFIGVSKAKLLTAEMVKSMNDKALIFAMANPIPEIMPDEAKSAGAFIVATGRSDFPNQINNVLAFPGIFRGALDNKVKQITSKMLIAAAEALAAITTDLTSEKIIPSPFDPGVTRAVANSIK